MDPRPSWDNYFLEIAKVAASRSTCLRAQVGSVIVSARKKIKATGYNGMPHQVKNCLEIGECYRIKHGIESGTRYETCRAIHSEQNAIIQAGEENAQGATIYIYGHKMVCILCKRFILQAGIKQVVLRHNPDSEVLFINPLDWIKEL
jgi:dCMP deaminase